MKFQNPPSAVHMAALLVLLITNYEVPRCRSPQTIYSLANLSTKTEAFIGTQPSEVLPRTAWFGVLVYLSSRTLCSPAGWHNFLFIWLFLLSSWFFWSDISSTCGCDKQPLHYHWTITISPNIIQNCVTSVIHKLCSAIPPEFYKVYPEVSQINFCNSATIIDKN